ncbi:MAG: DUF2924 domain-containing protein [Candidatus Omnitrophica bacterium]|nr:DUF2924 domain-containing protein [Candidatus Omnitrophota bacterium]MBU1047055.1 DUF2924 domain-containing protein [Candidatus Omnitrophota bacterium]MBU1767040.1 DUF2924 domain-containing protein [Candidatus Omnitrophota bacterium]MBU1889275.1 DUF2924 domain-containing protein [Candidatus Omnitrophota bacterium]
MAKGIAISQQIVALKNAPAEALLVKYKELYGEDTAGTHKTYLWRKIAYKPQELEKGSLSAKAKDRINELIKEYDPINNKALKPDKPIVASLKDKRIPIPGTVITKNYKGTTYQVKVLEKGFEFNSKMFKSLSAIAEEITGAHWNGYLFFNL